MIRVLKQNPFTSAQQRRPIGGYNHRRRKVEAIDSTGSWPVLYGSAIFGKFGMQKGVAG
ncbi:hypothetical protein NKH36_09680 [Mesorhizobium sp. M1312]|uniref:hypothetical protein n=1 Tax=unclassified Mesorhizobium TaxID=325217 RepID=UPI0033370AD0